MSDYLASLVAKALNRTEAVQPRLASRFEPPQETSDAMPSERFRLETTDDERVADASAGSPVETIQRSPHRAEASRSAPSQAELALDESRPEAPTGAATTSDRQSVRQPASPRVTAQASDTEPLRHASSLVLEPARDVSSAMPNVPLEATAYTAQHASPPPRMGPSASSLRDERTGVTRPRGDDDRSRPPTPEPERQASVVEAVGGSQDAPSPPITASSRIRSRRSSTPPQVVAQPQVTSSSAPSASLPVERMTAPDAGPTIRVHIGRVEVRAILPSAPAAPRPKPARRAPALSLDEYLKQRQGGQR